MLRLLISIESVSDTVLFTIYIILLLLDSSVGILTIFLLESILLLSKYIFNVPSLPLVWENTLKKLKYFIKWVSIFSPKKWLQLSHSSLQINFLLPNASGIIWALLENFTPSSIVLPQNLHFLLFLSDSPILPLPSLS